MSASAWWSGSNKLTDPQGSGHRDSQVSSYGERQDHACLCIWNELMQEDYINTYCRVVHTEYIDQNDVLNCFVCRYDIVCSCARYNKPE